MIVITGVELMKVRDVSYTEYMKSCMQAPAMFKPSIENYFEWEREVINGTIFMNANGERVVIGANKSVEDAIGLPFEVFNQQEKTIKSLRNYHRMWSHMPPWKMIKLAIRRWWDLKRGMVI